MNRWRDWDHLRESTPLEAKGGIRSQSYSGDFGSSWWAKRWISVLEGFEHHSRLARGRSYARSGQVLSIDILAGEVTAIVQGSRPTPYKIVVKVRELSGTEWAAVMQQLSAQALFAAKLLVGEMPDQIEGVFQSAGVSLFPSRAADLKTSCSCPDDSNPCKHIAAVYYLLGEEFDRDPFLLFKIRGMSRDQLLEHLGGADQPPPAAEKDPSHPVPLPANPEEFWNGPALPEHLLDPSSAHGAGAALPRRLGKMPFWRGRENFLEQLEAIYTSAAAKAAQVLSDRDR